MEQNLGVLCGFCGEENCNTSMSESKYACTAWNGKEFARRNLVKDEKCPADVTKCQYRFKMTKRDLSGLPKS